jgi:hypothetical protein
MAETTFEMLRRTLGNVPGPIGAIVSENAPIIEFLQRRRAAPARPPESPVTEPLAPAVTENPPSPFQVAQDEAARRRAAATRPPAQPNESPEMANALEQFQAAYRERLAAAQPQGQLSVLDMLRKRMARDMEGEALQRVGEFGAGMLASGSPNFFTMLGAGGRAAAEGDRARMEQLRRLAEAERQDAAQRAEEEYRRQQIAVERERRAAEQDPNNPRNRLYAAQAGFYERGGSGAGRMQVTPPVRLRAEAQALSEARTLFPDPPSTALNRDAEVARIQRERQAYIATRLPALLESLGAPGQVQAAPAAPAAPAVPTIEVNPVGRPAR